MSSSITPEGWSTDAEYFKLCDDESSSYEEDTDCESDTESESTSSSGYNSSKEGSKPKMLKGYLKNTKKYKKILFEETIFPE
jgi:hypothetical protein